MRYWKTKKSKFGFFCAINKIGLVSCWHRGQGWRNIPENTNIKRPHEFLNDSILRHIAWRKAENPCVCSQIGIFFVNPKINSWMYSKWNETFSPNEHPGSAHVWNWIPIRISPKSYKNWKSTHKKPRIYNLILSCVISFIF